MNMPLLGCEYFSNVNINTVPPPDVVGGNT